MKFKAIALLSALAAFTLNAEIIWQPDFSKDLAGFKILRKGPNDSVKVENEEIIFTFNEGKYKGMMFAQEVPFPEKFDISFDAAINATKSKGYQGFSLQFLPFGCNISWHASSSTVQYLSGNKWNTFASKIPFDKKINYRFRIDRVNKTMDVFYDGSMIPSASYKDVKFRGPVNGKGTLAFGNYGFPTGTIVNKISNLKMESVIDAGELTEPRLVWSEKFEKDGTLMDNGFKQSVDNKKDSFTVKDGVLTAVCQNSPYRGSSFYKDIPGLVRGELTFEAKVGEGNGYNHFCFTIKMGTLSMSTRATNGLQTYHGKKGKWAVVTHTKMTRSTWHKILVRFDSETHTTEYYIDDMENPVFIDTECEYEPKQTLRFVLSNYGLCQGAITNHFRNFELKAIPEKKKNDNQSLNGVMMFRGFSDEHWNVKALPAKLGESDVTEFIVQPQGPMTNNKGNRFAMQPIPNPNADLAKYIVLADLPAPIIPLYAQKHIVKSVENGAKLIVLGGMFSLQKGEYKGTELEKVLPVVLTDKWVMEPVAKSGAKVEKFNGNHKVISKAYGKGMVYVFPGNAIKDKTLAATLANYQF